MFVGVLRKCLCSLTGGHLWDEPLNADLMAAIFDGERVRCRVCGDVWSDR